MYMKLKRKSEPTFPASVSIIFLITSKTNSSWEFRLFRTLWISMIKCQSATIKDYLKMVRFKQEVKSRWTIHHVKSFIINLSKKNREKCNSLNSIFHRHLSTAVRLNDPRPPLKKKKKKKKEGKKPPTTTFSVTFLSLTLTNG